MFRCVGLLFGPPCAYVYTSRTRGRPILHSSDIRSRHAKPTIATISPIDPWTVAEA